MSKMPFSQDGKTYIASTIESGILADASEEDMKHLLNFLHFLRTIGALYSKAPYFAIRTIRSQVNLDGQRLNRELMHAVEEKSE